jgi:hypothetical protein
MRAILTFQGFRESNAARTGTEDAFFSAQPIGGFGYGLSMTATQASAYTLARKTLWEALTGLTLS